MYVKKHGNYKINFVSMKFDCGLILCQSIKTKRNVSDYLLKRKAQLDVMDHM